MTHYQGVLVPDDLVQSAFDWLHDNSKPAAAAKAARVRAEYKTKQVKARVFLESEGTVAEREAKALASDRYDEAVVAEIDAVEKDEFHRNQRSKAEAIIESWRTEQSNLRAMTKVG